MGFKYQIRDHQCPHFVSFSTVQWVDVLTRPLYKDIIVDSLRFCQQRKGLIIYAWVIMTNHVHLIASAQEGSNLSDILRDLKRYTSKRIIHAIENNPTESRRNWMLWIFKSAGEQNSNNKYYQFWQQGNHPIALTSNQMIDQRLEYLHLNPVKEQWVEEVHHYVYSSAIDYSGGKGLIPVEFIDW
ncbi:MAG: transposase [Bacteroidia bacterium]|nr:transposase [Bacteroidia bacterium]